MSEYKAQLSPFNELRPQAFSGIPARTEAVLTITPPVPTIGPKFARAILGQDPYGVNLEHIATLEDRSLFLAEAGTHAQTPEDRQATLHKISERILDMLHHPEKTWVMLKENPFPEPNELR